MARKAAPFNQLFVRGLNDTGSTISTGYGVTGSAASIELPDAITRPVLGVAAEDIADGSRGDVQYSGCAVAIAGEAFNQATIDAGIRVYCGTDGKFYVFDAASGVNQAVAGMPLSPSTGDGDEFDLLLGVGGIGQGA